MHRPVRHNSCRCRARLTASRRPDTPEFAVERPLVGLDRADRHVELGRDLGVRQGAREVAQHRPLPLGDRVDERAVCRRPRAAERPGHPLEQVDRERRAQRCRARSGVPRARAGAGPRPGRGAATPMAQRRPGRPPSGRARAPRRRPRGRAGRRGRPRPPGRARACGGRRVARIAAAAGTSPSNRYSRADGEHARSSVLARPIRSSRREAVPASPERASSAISMSVDHSSSARANAPTVVLRLRPQAGEGRFTLARRLPA